jgi:hypothetical protein
MTAIMAMMISKYDSNRHKCSPSNKDRKSETTMIKHALKFCIPNLQFSDRPMTSATLIQLSVANFNLIAVWVKCT